MKLEINKIMKYARFFVGFVLFISSFNLYAQFDTEFWFAPPYINPNHDKGNQFRLVFFTSEHSSTITITQPENPNFPLIERIITVNGTVIVNFSTLGLTQYVNVNQADVVSNNGLKITATNPVFCYYEVYSTLTTPLNTEIYSLKGKNALGTNFLIPMQNYLNNFRFGNENSWSSFMVLATEDDTEIRIRPTQDLVGHPVADGMFTVQLPKAGQFYVARATTMNANQHPAGTVVSSNKKIAITYNDDSIHGEPWGGGQDIGGDQIVPVNILGNEYIAVQGYLYNIQSGVAPYDQVFILGTEDDTQISINGAYLYTLNRGETRRYSFISNPLSAGSAVHIKGDKPIYVTQLSGFGCEVGSCILPAIECRGSKTVSVTRSSSSPFYLTLLTKTENIGNFTFYRNKTLVPDVIKATDFKPVPGMNTWQFAQKEINTIQLPVDVSARIDNSSGVFHLGVINGNKESTCRFGYFSDFAEHELKILSVSGDTLCEGQTLELMVDFMAHDFDEVDLQWKGPNKFTSSAPVILIPETNVSHSGIYSIIGRIASCSSTITPDTAFVLIKTQPVADFTAESGRCYPLPVKFTNTSPKLGKNTLYSWDFGDGSRISNDENPKYSYRTSGTSHKVQLHVSSQGCMDSIQYEVFMPERVESYNTDEFCNKSTYNFNGKPLTRPGTYVDTVATPDGCDSVVTLSLRSINPSIAIKMLTRDFCDEYEANLMAITNCDSVLWNTGESSTEILVTEPGLYTAVGFLENCEAVSTIRIGNCESYIYVPNVITPSALDGINDYLSLPCLHDASVISFEIIIHNRFGELVFHSTDKYFEWDGKVRGKIYANTVYSCLIFVQFANEPLQMIKSRITVL